MYGTITSSCAVHTRNGGWSESILVTTPKVLRDVDPNNLDRVITGTTRLLGPVPYRGGGIQVELGLFTAPGQDLLGPYLELLERAANLAGVGLLTTDAGLIRLVKDGLNLITGKKASLELEIGLSHLFDDPRPANYAVIRIGRSLVTDAPEYTSKGGLRWLDGSTVSEPYFLFAIEASSQRDDWANIPNLRGTYDQLRVFAERGDLVAARDTLETFRRLAVFSPDLLVHDGERLFALVEEQILAAFPATGTSLNHHGYRIPPFEELPLY